MFKELEEVMKGLNHFEKVGQQRAGVLATLTATLKGAKHFDTVEEFRDFIAMKILIMLQETPVGDFIDGKVVVTLTEMMPDALESMSDDTKASFKKLKALIEIKQDEFMTDDMMSDLDLPIEK